MLVFGFKRTVTAEQSISAVAEHCPPASAPSSSCCVCLCVCKLLDCDRIEGTLRNLDLSALNTCIPSSRMALKSRTGHHARLNARLESNVAVCTYTRVVDLFIGPLSKLLLVFSRYTTADITHPVLWHLCYEWNLKRHYNFIITLFLYFLMSISFLNITLQGSFNAFIISLLIMLVKVFKLKKAKFRSVGFQLDLWPVA